MGKELYSDHVSVNAVARSFRKKNLYNPSFFFILFANLFLVDHQRDICSWCLFINNKKSFITGDICKIVDKNFYFLNRIDRQVKILGNRIELDEIDNVIGDLTSDNSHSIIYKNKIYTFYTGKNLKNNLNIKLKKYLPKYMLPNKIKDKLLEEYDHCYTFDVEFDWAFCKYFWECHMHLPEIDISELERIVL